MDSPSNKPLITDDDWEEHNRAVERATATYHEITNGTTKATVRSKPQLWRRYLAIFIVVTVLMVGAYYVLIHKNDRSDATHTQTAKNTSQLSAAEAATKPYTSNTFGLMLSYPAIWELSEPTGSNKLTITSPVTTLMASSGKSVEGKIILTIRPHGQPLTEFDKGNAVAARDSEMLHYTRPTQSQRASTYLSFLTNAGNTTGGLDELYVTGDYGYKLGQAIPAADIMPADPLISVTFAQCVGQKCRNTSPLSVSPNVWDKPEVAKPVRNVLQSLAVQ